MPHVAKTAVLTSTRREWRPVVRLDLTTVGTARSENLLASVAPPQQLSVIARGVEGIIGQDFLFELNFTLDYRRRRLTWNDGGTFESGARVPLVAREGRYLVQIDPDNAGQPMLLVPDSGSNGIVIFSRAARDNPIAKITHGCETFITQPLPCDCRLST
jgi:hypothetical protein